MLSASVANCWENKSVAVVKCIFSFVGQDAVDRGGVC